MAKKSNSGGNGATLTLLEAILEANKRTNEELVQLRKEMVQLRTEMVQGFEQLGARIDNITLGPFGEMVRRHEREIDGLRSKVDSLALKLGGTPG